MRRKIRKAVFPVGGLGTRFLPATKAMPKEMLPVVDKPLIQYAVEEARAAGIEELIFVTGRGKDAIEDHFDRSYELEDILAKRGKTKELEDLNAWMPAPGAVAYTRQVEPKGLGHAVLCAQNLIGDEPFAVLLADDLILSKTPCLKQMVEVYETYGGNVIAAADVPREQTDRYGIINPGADHGRVVEVRGLVEKPAPDQAPSTICVIGRYILDPSVFRKLQSVPPGSGGEIQLTDALAAMVGETAFHGLRYEGLRFDCGDKAGFLMANLAFALERPKMKRDLTAFIQDLAARLR